MSMNLIAILISLAMMLTGAGGEGQPAEAARTLTLRDIALTINGERVSFDPVARLGAASDGQTALFQFGIEADGDTLLPIQLAADESGVTALFEKSDVALNVTAQALESLTQNIPVQPMDAEDSDTMAFITGELIPAYAGMIQAVSDEAFVEEMQAKSEAILDSVIDRGEGKPVTEEVEGRMVDLTEYHYTVDSPKLAELCDALLTSNDVFKAYYDALFGLFARMPAETGFSGIKSYRDMFETMGFDMTMEMDEKRSDDGDIQMMDAVLTMDMSGMAAKMAEEQGAAEMPEMEPIVMTMQGTNVGKNQTVNMDMTFGAGDMSMDMSMRGTQGESSMMMDMVMSVRQGDEQVGSMRMDAGQGVAGAKGNTFTHFNVDFNMGEQGSFEFSFRGNASPDGVAEGDFNIGVVKAGDSFSLAFIADVTPDAIENRVAGHKADVVIDDLSQEGLSAITQDPDFTTAMMKVSGTMFADIQKLYSNEGVQSLMALLSATREAGEEVPYEVEITDVDGEDAGDYEIELGEGEGDDEYVIDLSDLEFEDGDDVGIQIEGMDEDYEEIEDDGVLGFDLPELSWLPEGWAVSAQSEDTAYDWADFSVQDANGEDSMYALFFADTDDSQATYIVSDDGAIQPVEGREISLTDFGDEGMSVSWRENGLYVNLMFYSGAIEMDTIGRIVSGIRF